MYESVYVGLSGLMGFSKELNVLSNNVANLNTPGFKSSQLQFEDLYYQLTSSGGDSSTQIGTGLGTGSTTINMKQGELRATGNDLDLAINGSGLFVLRKDNHIYYTRAGQFQFDANGYLIDGTSKARVAAISGSSNLQDINLNGLRSNPPKGTGIITFTGNLSTGSTQQVISNTTVYDAAGGSHQLTLTFDNNNSNVAGGWNITVADPSGTVATGQIQISNGAPVPGSDKFTFTYSPANSPSSSVTLDFTKDVTGYSAGTTSTLQVNTQDGYTAGALTKATFDKDGYLTITYSNGQTTKHDQIALAWFDQTSALRLEGNNTFVNNKGLTPIYGAPNTNVFGAISAGKIEISNVDLTQQFGDLIITQRGYQASSQVVTAANEMMQQLLDLKSRR